MDRRDFLATSLGTVAAVGQAAIAAAQNAAAAQTASAVQTTMAAPEAAAATTETATTETGTAAAPAANASAAAGGEQIYQTVCTACHTAGVAGAPMPGSAAMQERLAAKGLDGLVSSAINGLNVMPPKGGRPDLSDADIRAAVEFMLK
jgi:cytochrome c5